MAMTQGDVASAARPAATGRGGVGYRILYTLGIKPWDQDTVPPELKAFVEGPERLAPGRALDLGCGTGTQALYMARHGFRVTGVDFVARPLEVARSRAVEAGLDVRLIEGDVTRLPELGVGDDFTLLLDSGCLHGLDARQRAAYAAGVGAAAAHGATFLIFSFRPAFRGPAPRGLSRDEIVSCFRGQWQLMWDRPAQGMKLPGPLRNSAPSWYCLQRT